MRPLFLRICLQPLLNVRFYLRHVVAEDVVALLRVAFELNGPQASDPPVLRKRQLGQLGLPVDGVQFLAQVVVVLKAVDNAIDATLSLLHEPIVELLSLGAVHVSSRMQQVAQIRLDLHFPRLVNDFYGSDRPNLTLLVEVVREHLEVNHRRLDFVNLWRLCDVESLLGPDHLQLVVVDIYCFFAARACLVTRLRSPERSLSVH